MDYAVVICMLANRLPYSEARRGQCTACKRDVWISRGSEKDMQAKNLEIKPYCISCIKTELKEEKEKVMIREPGEESIKAIAKHEGISVEEMKKRVKALTAMIAEEFN